MFLAASR
ncbi:hypothetical protein F383_37727 [Gossypium arboreum]|nr:hypothetical protein F383_37727 [Gossypium arboreum]